MGILLQTTECPVHGHYVGRVCPRCDAPLPCGGLPEPSRAAWHRGPERELHDWMEAEMQRLGVAYVHGRMDQKSTIKNGWPDFSLFRAGEDGVARVCFVELKNRGGKLSADQKRVIADLEAKGLPVLVTGDFRKAVEFVREKLKINNL